MRCVVTGSLGFIGRELVSALRAEGHEACGVDLPVTEGVATPPEFIGADLTQWSEMLGVFARARPEVVFHLGALISTLAEKNPQLAYRVNVDGTYNVLELCRLLGVKTLVYASTVAVFGRAVSSPVGDDAPQLPSTMYGATKVACEQFGAYYQRKYGLDFRALRIPTVTGPTRKALGAGAFATQMLLQPALGNAYTVPVAADTQVALLYIKDAVSALQRLAFAPESSLRRRVYNIRGLPVTPGSMIDAVRHAIPDARIDILVDPSIQAIVGTWPILDQSNAEADWGLRMEFDVQGFTADFIADARRIAANKEKA